MQFSIETRVGLTALKIPVLFSAGGHNNIKLNPVFRGMIRRYGERD